MSKITFFLAFLCLLALSAMAQTGRQTIPPSFNCPDTLVSDACLLTVPRPGNIDPYSGHQPGAQPFAKIVPLDLHFPASLVPDTLASGLLYRFHIYSPDASSLGLCLSDLELQDGVELYLYGADAAHILGPYTCQNTNPGQILRTPQIPGCDIFVEMLVPSCLMQSSFSISKLYYDFSGPDTESKIRSKDLASSYNVCSINEDINSQYGIDYQALKHSVVRYTFENGSYLYYCTGVLVNTTLCDTTPYLLTAAHCICDQERASSMVSYFNFELQSASSRRGSIFSDQTLSGATLVATSPQLPYIDKYGKESREKYPSLDFALLRLPEIPRSYQPYFAGVHVASADNSRYHFLIHHPSGGQKSISITNSLLYTDNYPDEDYECHYLPQSHWHVERWHHGTSQGGSSGGPLFNADNQVIGTLSGGYASCSKPIDDYFAKISKSWDYFPEPCHQLRHWLSPNGNITDIMPYDPYNIDNPLSKSALAGVCNDDSSSINLSWKISGSSLFESDFNSFDSQDDVNTVFYSNVDHLSSKSNPWKLVDTLSHSGLKCLASVKSAMQAVSHYLVLPKLELAGTEVLSFYARSTSGKSTLSISYSSRASRFQNLKEVRIGEEWTRFDIDLSALGFGGFFININNISSHLDADTLFIDDISIKPKSSLSQTAVCTGYKLYCNNQLVRTFNDPSISSCDFDISHDHTYTFYILNLYGDDGESGKSNTVTVSPGYVYDPSTIVGDLEIGNAPASIRLYPNPAAGDLFLACDSEISDATADLIDYNGRLLLSIPLGDICAGQQYPVPDTHLSSGHYVLVLRSGRRYIASIPFIICR